MIAAMERAAVRDALLAARDHAGAPVVAPDEIGEIALEGNWIGVALGKELSPLQAPRLGGPRPPEPAERSLLATAYEALKARFPEAKVELRAPGTVYRGGAGWGEGKHVVAVLGGKGGVGKSTVSVNLALTLAAMGLKVGVLDGDINGPDVPHLLGFHLREEQKGFGWSLHSMKLVPPSRRRVPHRRYDVELLSVGFVVPEGAPTMLHGRVWVAMLLRHLTFDVAWDADVLIVDAPPGTGDEIHVMTGQLPLSGALFVTTPQDLAQMDAERTLSLLRKNGVPVIGLVQNMAALTCPHCEREIDMFSDSSRLSDQGVAVLGRVPFDTRLSAAADRGMPLVLADGRGEIAREFARVAFAVRKWLAAPRWSG
jgi:ATP-binding protein involved in chromosome partitioning